MDTGKETEQRLRPGMLEVTGRVLVKIMTDGSETHPDFSKRVLELEEWLNAEIANMARKQFGCLLRVHIDGNTLFRNR